MMPTTSEKVALTGMLRDTSKALEESTNQTRYPQEKEVSSNSSITRYLLEHVEEFRQLTELRRQVDEPSAIVLASVRQDVDRCRDGAIRQAIDTSKSSVTTPILPAAKWHWSFTR